MMFHKPLISLVAVLAATSSVAASAVPVPRGDGGYAPPTVTPISISQCNTGSAQCCNTYTSNSNPLVGILSALLGLTGSASLGVGLSCLPILASSIQCNNSPVCCDNVSQNGLINFGCTPINLGL